MVTVISRRNDRVVLDLRKTYEADATCDLVEDGAVVDIWPIMPRGPLHGGLLQLLEGQA